MLDWFKRWIHPNTTNRVQWLSLDFSKKQNSIQGLFGAARLPSLLCMLLQRSALARANADRLPSARVTGCCSPVLLGSCLTALGSFCCAGASEAAQKLGIVLRFAFVRDLACCNTERTDNGLVLRPFVLPRLVSLLRVAQCPFVRLRSAQSELTEDQKKAILESSKLDKVLTATNNEEGKIVKLLLLGE